MAMIFLGKSKCPLCGEVLESGQELVATTHFIESPEHPLWRFSDAAMHYTCFQLWEHREPFVAKYNAEVDKTAFHTAKPRPYMSPDGRYPEKL